MYLLTMFLSFFAPLCFVVGGSSAVYIELEVQLWKLFVCARLHGSSGLSQLIRCHL